MVGENDLMKVRRVVWRVERAGRGRRGGLGGWVLGGWWLGRRGVGRGDVSGSRACNLFCVNNISLYGQEAPTSALDTATTLPDLIFGRRAMWRRIHAESLNDMVEWHSARWPNLS